MHVYNGIKVDRLLTKVSENIDHGWGPRKTKKEMHTVAVSSSCAQVKPSEVDI